MTRLWKALLGGKALHSSLTTIMLWWGARILEKIGKTKIISKSGQVRHTSFHKSVNIGLQKNEVEFVCLTIRREALAERTTSFNKNSIKDKVRRTSPYNLFWFEPRILFLRSHHVQATWMLICLYNEWRWPEADMSLTSLVTIHQLRKGM